MISRSARPSLFGFALSVAFVLLPIWVKAEESASQVRMVEHKIKAALLYNFLKYVAWPNGTEPTASLCIFGENALEDALAPLSRRTVNQKRISVRRIYAAPEAVSCELLFVDEAERGRWPQLLSATSGSSVLTVSDSRGFLRSGGMVELRREKRRIHVRVNLAAITAADLRVHDRLLRLVELEEEP